MLTLLWTIVISIVTTRITSFSGPLGAHESWRLPPSGGEAFRGRNALSRGREAEPGGQDDGDQHGEAAQRHEKEGDEDERSAKELEMVEKEQQPEMEPKVKFKNHNWGQESGTRS